MTISYPLTMPATPFPRVQGFRLRNAVAAAQSPFTYSQQTQAHQGQIWLADITLPRMPRSLAAAWTAFFAALRGKWGTFYLDEYEFRVPLGAASGVPLVSTAGSPTPNIAADRILYTKGWTTGVTGILKAGDRIQLGSGANSKYHMVTQDANSDGSGNATLCIEPALRAAYTDGAAITVQSPKGVFRLTDNETGWTSDQARQFDFTFGAMEVLP